MVQPQLSSGRKKVLSLGPRSEPGRKLPLWRRHCKSRNPGRPLSRTLATTPSYLSACHLLSPGKNGCPASRTPHPRLCWPGCLRARARLRKSSDRPRQEGQSQRPEQTKIWELGAGSRGPESPSCSRAEAAGNRKMCESRAGPGRGTSWRHRANGEEVASALRAP